MKLEGKGKLPRSAPVPAVNLLRPAFIITGGCGSIGGTTARAIVAKGGIVVVS